MKFFYTWRRQPLVIQATRVAQSAPKTRVLLLGRAARQEHAQHRNVLVVLLGPSNALGAHGFRGQVQARLHIAGQNVSSHIGSVFAAKRTQGEAVALA